MTHTLLALVTANPLDDQNCGHDLAPVDRLDDGSQVVECSMCGGYLIRPNRQKEQA